MSKWDLSNAYFLWQIFSDFDDSVTVSLSTEGLHIYSVESSCIAQPFSGTVHKKQLWSPGHIYLQARTDKANIELSPE